MNWVLKNWRWLLINGIASLLFLGMVNSAITTDFTERALKGLVHTTGEWSMRFLLLSLLMTPLYILFGWTGVLALRKSTGLWAFAFGTFHLAAFIMQEGNILSVWREALGQWSLIVGLAPLLIMLPLALTSTDGLMRKLGKWWKPLHRTVYVAAVFTLLHVAMLGHLPLPDMILLAASLLLRVPAIRHWLVERRSSLRRLRVVQQPA